MKKTVLLIALAAASLNAHAYKLDRMLNCDLPVRDFFAPLVQDRAISTPAFRVTDTSVNFFRPTSTTAMTFYNMQVGSVWGYTNDPLLFQHTAGTNPPDGYGIFVQAPIAEVQATLQSIGNTRAQVRRMDANATAIFCELPS